MRKWSLIVALAGLMLLGSGELAPAHADVAPPPMPPGASVATGQYQTNVRMVSENVLMTIDDYTPPVVNEAVDLFVVGHVDATFEMLNEGSETESFDVWFPIGVENWGGIMKAGNFRAWVDGVPADQIGEEQIPDPDDDLLPWATWPATFPPGKPVTLRVTYDTYGRGRPPWATMAYILHTGAGWAGTIGEGTITIRLPYDVTTSNADVDGEAPDIVVYPVFSGGPHTVSGRDVVWHFTDLEPSEENDIALTVLTPAVWRQIQAAQEKADANPGSVGAQLALARTLQKGMYIKGEVYVEVWGSTERLVRRTYDAYDAVLALDPQNMDIYIEYLSFININDISFADSLGHFQRVFDAAYRLAPDDPRLAEFKFELEKSIAAATSNAQADAQSATQHAATQDATQYASMLEAFEQTSAARATTVEEIRLAIITATATPTFEPEPDTPTASATSDIDPYFNKYNVTATPSPQPTVTPTPPGPPLGSGNVSEWTMFVLPAVIAVIILAVWLRRRSKAR